MPIYEFKCDICGNEFERLVKNANSTDPVQCLECAAFCSRKMSRFAFPNSPKQWGSRKGVNYAVDTADVVYKKQLKIMGNKPKPKHLTTSQWNKLLAVHKTAAENTKPEKVL